MKNLIRIVIYSLAFILPIVAVSAYGFYSTATLTQPNSTEMNGVESSASLPSTKSYDPAKPTVAIVLGSTRTEDTDFLIPYQLFSASKVYNVYAVAPERKTTSLAGGLEVLPDLSYTELASLIGKAPDVVVIPAFPNVDSEQNKPILTWIKQQSDRGSYIFSICVGAEVFAATGLLDGRTATTHWGDIDRIEERFPAVNWVRGVRYVDGGAYMTSAGITSGIDAILHYIAQHNGEQVARVIAEKIHYPSYAFVEQPQVEQYSTSARLFAVGLINILFHWSHPTAGVLLYDGINELELAATYDTYAATYTTRLVSISQTRKVIKTEYGLNLIPQANFDDVPAMERLIVPGSQAQQLAQTEVNGWQQHGNVAPVFFLHADHPNQFAFDAPLRDLAHQENIPTAVLNAMRLEYRPGVVQTEGPSWPLWLTVRPLLIGLVGLSTAWIVRKRLSSPR